MKIENCDYLGQQIDISEYFYSIGHIYYNISEMTDFDLETMAGTIKFTRHERKGRMAFNMYTSPFEEAQSWAFPPAYSDTPSYPIRIAFPAENIVRIYTSYSNLPLEDNDSLMLEKNREIEDVERKVVEKGVELRTSELQVQLQFKPFSIIIKDKNGKVLTKTLNQEDGKCLLNCNPLPFSYVHKVDDYKKYAAASLSIFPNEHFYGCGESFTKLDKTGQKVVLWTKDPHGVETQDMYKPVPFYMSSRGYGVFTHTSAPVTFDFGHNYQEAQTIFIGEEDVDIFVIAGTPKEILEGYTEITGKSQVPPLWSFGLWMSRITYESEAEAREVAAKLKEYEIPCDVIHLDTGWFEYDWRCDYEFSSSRFDDPGKMIQDLREDGYRICLWQLPYFTPNNVLYREIVDNGYAVVNADGKLPTDDAILDFSNPEAVKWYQSKIEELLDLGVAAIKVDFGEAAPLSGAYHSGQSGTLEHNLYPLRYNKAVADITKEVTGEDIIWARSAWAGSQRYPLHWGGDCENTNMGMLASLRGGLSLGMCGFTYWSHDVGGFVQKSPEELYKRWTFMGIFTSHMRCHGAPPKEPWNYSDEFLELFRKQLSFRYRLMPYIYAQSINSSAKGYPMMRSMFFEFPEDRNCLELEDQYMFGDNILVAPLFEDNATCRDVYLPDGKWIDLFSKKCYDGGRWHNIPASELCGVALVKDGSVIPMVDSALTTDAIDWDSLAYHWFTSDEDKCFGLGIEYSDKKVFDLDKELMSDYEAVIEKCL